MDSLAGLNGRSRKSEEVQNLYESSTTTVRSVYRLTCSLRALELIEPAPYLQDLVFVEENVDRVNDKLINFEKVYSRTEVEYHL